MIKLKHLLEGVTHDIQTLVDDGLNTEYPEIAQAIQKYTYDLDVSGLDEAVSNVNYGAYKADLDRILLRFYPNGRIPVRRILNYLGANFTDRKPKNLKYTSVSILPNWGKGKQVKEWTVDIRDVIAAGHMDEGELIVKSP